MNPEDLLTDAFRDRTEHTDYPSTPLSAVAARAGAVRARRRRTTVLAAAAVVAVVAVPGALWLNRSPGASPQPGRTLSSGPTTQPTTRPTDHLGGPRVLDALPLGAKPGIDYLVDDTYVTMNGDRVTDPVFGSATTGTPVRGGILVSVPPAPGLLAQDGIATTHLVTDGQDHSLGCGSDRFAMSTDGVESAYWLADSCPVGSGVAGRLYSGVNNTMGDSGPGAVSTPAGHEIAPVGILSQGVVVNGTHGRTSTVEIVDPSGHATPVARLKLAGGSDENNDVVSGQLASASTTGAVVDASTGAVRWRAPGWALGQFSDDGKYVVAEQLAHPGVYAILDATTGDQTARLDRIGGHASIRQLAWDFDDTVLAVASTDRDEAILRFDRQGQASRATPTLATGDTDRYRLATRP